MEKEVGKNQLGKKRTESALFNEIGYLKTGGKEASSSKNRVSVFKGKYHDRVSGVEKV